MSPAAYYADEHLTILEGDAASVLATLEPESVHCVVTSPPYWGLRDYGTPGQLGLEATPEAYVEALVGVFREVRRVLRSDGTVWLNLGDCYHSGDRGGYQPSRVKAEDSLQRSNLAGDFHGAPNRMPQLGLKDKDLVGIPWRVAFALQADGWYLRSDIIWAKPNPMPESVTDRPTKSHEYVFLLSKSARYYFDADAVRLPISENWKPNGGPPVPEHGYHVLTEGRTGHQVQRAYDEPKGANVRTVWTVATQPYPGAHFATFPEALVEPCIKAGCPEGGVVLDPFAGTGTAGLVAQRLSRRAVLIDLNAEYLAQCLSRNRQVPLGLYLSGVMSA